MLERLKKVGDYTIVGGGGDYSDFQSITKQLDELVYVAMHHSIFAYPSFCSTIKCTAYSY